MCSLVANAKPQTFVDPVMVMDAMGATDAMDAMDPGTPMHPDGEPPPLVSAEPICGSRRQSVSRLSSDGHSSAEGFVEILKQIQARCDL